MKEFQTLFAFRSYHRDLDKFKDLRERSGLTWASYIKYVNRLVKEDLNRKVASELSKINREEN